MRTIIKCGKLFSGINEEVEVNKAILVEDTMIKDICSFEDIETIEGIDQVLDMSDRFIMPGMIDAHVHVCMDGSPSVDPLYKKLNGEITLSAMIEAQKDLMAGFTTLRDEGGIEFADVALKHAIDSGMVDGPRLFVSGKPLTTTGGHGDSHFSPGTQEASVGMLVNSPDEARKAARYNFKYGADQVKLFATGGVMSFGDEPGASELSYEEMKAALDVAKDKGRISSAHAHGAQGIKNAIRAGVTSIEHGMLIDEEAMDMMKDYGVYLLPTIIAADRIVENGRKGLLPKWMVDKADDCLKEHRKNIKKMLGKGIKIGFGTDAGTAFDYHGQQAYEFELMLQSGFTPAKALLAATKVNAELLGQEKNLGSIEKGKKADIIGFASNPLEDIALMSKCIFVMKDGKVYKQ